MSITRREALELVGASGLAAILGTTRTRAGSESVNKKEWEYNAVSPHISPIEDDNSRIYFGTGKAVAAVDIQTGEKIWRTDVKGGRVSNSPEKRRELFVTSFQNVASLSPESGDVNWKREISTGGNTKPIVASDTLVVAHGTDYRTGTDSKVLGIDRSDGTKIWENELGGDILVTPVLKEGNVYVVTSTGTVTRINTKTGETDWETNIGTAITTQPLSHGNNIIIIGELGDYYQIDSNSGEIVRHFSTIRPQKNSHMLFDGSNVLIPGVDGLGAINQQRGLTWFYATPGGVVMPTSVGKYIYFGDTRGNIHRVNSTKGTGKKVADFTAVSQGCSDHIRLGVSGTPIVNKSKYVIPRSGGLITAINRSGVN